MSLSDIVRNISKSMRDTLSEREQLKEKAKGLPMHALQATLSGFGHALLLGDRVRNKIKRLGRSDADERADGTPPAEPQPADKAGTAEKTVATEKEQAVEVKPARREPVIFAPRPVQPEAAPNGDGQRADSGALAETAVPTPRPEPAQPSAQPTVQPPVQPPAEAPQPPLEAAARPPAEPLETTPETPAEAPAAPPEPTSAEVEEKVAEAVAKSVEAAEEPATEAAESGEQAKSATLTEPMPGYAELTIASLRARMRGKSADQVRELLAYEKATANRAEVVRMYENRLAKLAAAG